jgi:eukaryotic-like serine/threonine-protein kinase
VIQHAEQHTVQHTGGTAAVVGGRYPLDLRIATGGMGEVWRATDLVLDRPVAVKILKVEYADDAVFWERFRAEAHNMAALRHAGIAQVHDFGQTAVGGATVPYIVMEFVPGDPLSAILERQGALSVDRALDLVAQAAEALHAAHEAGVVHRDVKPANLLVTPAGAVKVTDFGIARAGDALPLTRTGTVMGTAHYLAPELARSEGAASPLSDVYALGVVLYECLAGRRPFPGDNPVAVALAHLQEEPPELPSWLPEPVRCLVAMTMAKNPMARPASAAELARQLVRLQITGELAEPVRLAGAATDASSDAGARGVATPGVDHVGRDPQNHSPRARSRHARRAASLGRGARLMMVAGALLLVLAVAWLLLTPGSGSAIVPKVTGMREAEARAQIAGLGFPLEIKRQVNRTVPSGVVVEQRPVPGTESSLASPVLLVVSAGLPRVRVEDADWLGRPYEEVAAELRRYGLEVSRRPVRGQGPAGTVADVSPDGLVPVGDTVTVSVVER